MKTFTYTIRDEVGIHARPAGMLVNKAKEFECGVTVHKDGRSADAKKLFSLMGLGVKCGDFIQVEADGADEDAAIAALSEFFEANL